MRLVLERFAHNALALLAVTTILFFMFRLMPGTPLAAFINENLNADQQQAMLEQFGLDRPMWQQYFIYLGNLLRGEFGLSFFQRRPVLDILLEVLPNSVILTLTSLIIAYIFGVLAGAWLAWKRGSWIEGVAVPAVLATRAAPEFWIGMVLLALFVVQARLVPLRRCQQPRGWPTPTTGSASSRWTTSIISPCRSLTLGPLPAGPAAAADALQHARGDARGVRHHGAHEGPARNGASSSATPRATRCCRSSPPSRSASACRWAATS